MSGMPAKPAPAAAENWAALDWAQPWLESVRSVGEPLCQRIAQGLPVHQALNLALPNALRDVGLRFVAQHDLPEGVAYETFIFHERKVPTRDNFHDFFNGLIWLHWPHLKLHLNALQASEIARDGVQQRRGPLRDAITVLDENGAIWLAPQQLIEALQARDWQRLMVKLRPLWQHSRLLPVGHALLEKLVFPRKPITAHVLCLSTECAGQAMTLQVAQGLQTALLTPAEVDAALVAWPGFAAPALATKPFSPLPVLGVPGWWSENANFSFYDDSFVFRSQRSAKNIPTPEPAQVTAA